MPLQIEICTGKDCKKHKKKLQFLRLLLAERYDVRKVSCLGVCKGPVLVVRTKKYSCLFYRLRKPKELKKFWLWLQAQDSTTKMNKIPKELSYKLKKKK